jgi:CheY-like chemotaxis protein
MDWEGIKPNATPAEEAAAFRGFRILLIDDVEPLLKIMAKGLTRYGQRVFPAISGQAGLEILKAHPVDVVVCDMGMPVMDGWKVAEEVQSFCRDKGIPRIPFILLTGWAAELSGSPRNLANLGVDMIMDKPVEIPALIRAVAEVVSNRVGSG